MKARFIRDDMEYVGVPHLRADDTRTVQVMRNGKMTDILCWNLGATVEGPEAFRLVQMGVAESADDECEQRAGMTPEKKAAAQYSFQRLRKGIHPDDFDRYDRGELIGYNPDGSDIHGPNWISTEEIEEEEDEDDE